jgi:diketogulonate reductase-like aldo/keto reductase
LGGGVLNAETWSTPIPLKDEIILEIAKSHGKSPAQVLLRYLLQRGIVVLPKSVKPHRMAENKDILDFHLTADEMSKIGTLDKYQSYKTNPIPLSAFLGGPDAFSKEGTDIFD